MLKQALDLGMPVGDWRQDVFSTIVFALAWAFFFVVVYGLGKNLLPCKDSRQTLDLWNRTVSLTHGLIVLFGCGYCALNAPAGPFAFGVELSEDQRLLFQASAGYFVYDTLFMHLLGIGTTADDFHHAAVLSAFAFALGTGRYGTENCLGAVTLELSNPSMHLRFMFKDLGINVSNPRAYEYNEYAFVFFFFFGRLVLGSAAVYLVGIDPDVHVIIKLASSALWLVSAFWFKLILDKVRKHAKHVSAGYWHPHHHLPSQASLSLPLMSSMLRCRFCLRRSLDCSLTLRRQRPHPAYCNCVRRSCKSSSSQGNPPKRRASYL